MKILFTRFPLESAYGGAEVQTLSLMRGLRERGHEVAFLGSCPVLLAKSAESPAFAHSAPLGASAGRQVPRSKLDIGPPPVTKWGALSFFVRRHAMKRKLLDALSRSGEPWLSAAGVDVVCMLSLSEKLLLTPYALEKGMRVFWIEHDRIGRWLTRNPWLPRLRRLSEKVTTIVVSDLSRRMYIGLGWNPEKVVAIPDGVDPRRLGAPVTQRIHHELLRIGCVARLTKDKGIDLLIEAMSDLPGVSLRVIGEGRGRDALLSLIQKLHLGNRVTIERHAENLGDFYRSLDLLVLPSREHDPFGMVAAEAMMLGIPVIVTDACGIAGYLRNGEDAIVAAAGSSGALKEAIELLQDHKLRARMALAGEKTAEENFATERMVDRYEKMFKERESITSAASA